MKRTNTYQGKVIADYSYERKTIDNRTIVRETMKNNQSSSNGDYIEYENFSDPEGKLIKVNFWAHNEQKNNWEIFQVEQNAEYSGNQLTVLRATRPTRKAIFQLARNVVSSIMAQDS